jgi:hypothetical protein
VLLVEGGTNSLTGVDDSLKAFGYIVLWALRAEMLIMALLLRTSFLLSE